MKPTKNIMRLYEDLQTDLDRISARFKNPKVTLIVRNPDIPEGDVVFGNDELDSAIESVRRLQAKSAFIVDSRSCTETAEGGRQCRMNR
jgi:hypothetical protein